MAVILLVEDEVELADVVEAYLQREGHTVERAHDGERAASLFLAVRPDLVLLDIILPGRDGLSLLQQFQESAPQTPVLMLTAKAEDDDKLRGLDLGADDYIVKPFNPREVVARVRAVLRRSQGSFERALIRVGPLELDEASLEATVSGTPLRLTATEFRLLTHLAKHPQRVFSRLELLDAALPERDALERVIDSHLKNIRRKLAKLGAGELIETVYGMGYSLRDVPRGSSVEPSIES